ncbi:MAG: hypothetical protein CTR55_25820 [Pseudomonas sp.]|uniref:hypothetical protein n=1 Tax=Pseudomonas sp. TaxID=306 RepID=UPI000CC45228|nr:hypothetical protein [Pseudomonas sp.]PJI46295.1 MAG: hypothetical protein CTR55_25820 [Pseudomonas sp.]
MKKLCILIAACAVLAACDKKDEQASKTAVPAAAQQEAKPAAQPEAKPAEQAAAPAQPATEEAKPADDKQQ